MQTLIKNIRIINLSDDFIGNIYIKNGLIEKISKSEITIDDNTNIIDGTDKIIIPGVIDDQVHFREPGLTHKANIYTESKAAVAGGVTSFMDMPNVNPQTTTIEELDAKFIIGDENSLANFSFYFGATNDNIEEIKKVNPKTVCGVKTFMGSSTGNMLVDNIDSLNAIFKHSPVLIATHCEDEKIIVQNTKIYTEKYGDNIPVEKHPEIRSREACIKSSQLAISLAKKHNSRLHVLHITTKEEAEAFENILPSKDKRITAEVCVHHLWFNADDYAKQGAKIKCNPAVKYKSDQDALFTAMMSDKIDVIATDHAPHLLSEKDNKYNSSPSGIPLVQHSLVAMLEFYHQEKISLNKIVDKMCHKPAEIFQIENRGFIKEGYFADLTIIDLKSDWEVNKENILYKCEWSPFDGYKFKSKVTHTFVNGNLIYNNGEINENFRGKRLSFNR